jgi:Flp pilus assembly protein TadB
VPTQDGDKKRQPTSFRVLAAHPNIVVGINTSAFYSYTVWVLLAGLVAVSVPWFRSEWRLPRMLRELGDTEHEPAGAR